MWNVCKLIKNNQFPASMTGCSLGWHVMEYRNFLQLLFRQIDKKKLSAWDLFYFPEYFLGEKQRYWFEVIALPQLFRSTQVNLLCQCQVDSWPWGISPWKSARTVWGFCFNWYCSYWSHLIMRLFSRVSLAEMMISNTWGTGKFLSWWSVLVLFCPVTSPEFQLCLYQSTKRSCSHTHLKSTADIRELGVYFVSCYHFCPECSLETLSVPPVDATCCLTTKWLTSLGPYWFLKL